MINLLKADFFRVFRTKIVYISLMVAIVLPLFINGVNYLTYAAALAMDPELVETGLGDSILTSTFSPLMSFNYIFAVFPVIVIMMDFGNGTIRDKLIHGFTRHQIFAAHFIISLAYSVALTTLFATTNVICSVFMLGISEIPQNLVIYYVSYFLIGFLGVVMIASIGSGLALSLSNAGAIILTVVSVLFFNYFGNILDLILRWNGIENAQNILSLFPYYLTETVSGYLSYGAEPTTFELIHYIEAVLGVLIVSGGFYALGTFVFNKKDLK